MKRIALSAVAGSLVIASIVVAQDRNSTPPPIRPSLGPTGSGVGLQARAIHLHRAMQVASPCRSSWRTRRCE